MELRTVLVTGAAGYVGSHTCKALARAGFYPVAYDDLSTGHSDAVRWGPLVIGDVRDDQHLSRVLRRTRAIGILHFAARASVGESMRDPGGYFDHNVGGTMNVCRAARAAEVDVVVFSSSCAVYGAPHAPRLAESHACAPQSPYGESKLAAERILGWYDTCCKIRNTILRYFNSAGADPDGEVGESHQPETHLIPLAIRAALRRGPPLELYGDDYATADGTCIRDYVHVSDLADAHVRALEHLLAGGASCTLNLGSGCGASVREVLESIEAVLKVPVPVRVRGRRPGDPSRLVADVQRVRAVLGWAPTRSSLHRIVETAAAWEQRRPSSAPFERLARQEHIGV